MYIYIYIYIYREREREDNCHTDVLSSPPCPQATTKNGKRSAQFEHTLLIMLTPIYIKKERERERGQLA